MNSKRADPPSAHSSRTFGIFGVLFLAGCGASQLTNYTPSQPVHAAPKTFTDEMMTYVSPAKPFAVAGRFQTQGFDSPDAALNALREKAAALGLDGISNIHCGSGLTYNWVLSPLANDLINTGKSGDCVGQGFMWEHR